MTTTLQRLLRHPHSAVFDKSPGADLALRVRHPDGAAWSVAEEVLTVKAGGLERAYALSGLTIGALAAYLEADGFEVPTLTPHWAGISAMTLIEGAGNQGVSNGDRLQSFTSVLWGLLSGYAGEVRDAKHQVGEALRQMVVTQAGGDWLDLWGNLYAAQRASGEQDAAYAQRIPSEAFRVRINAFAIEQAVKDATGKSVEIREPWKLMFRLGESGLSGAHHMHDADFYTPHVIQPVMREPVDMTVALAVIERNRAAGVIVSYPAFEPPVSHINITSQIEYEIGSASEQLRIMSSWPGGEAPLGAMRLDDNSFALNHAMLAYQLLTFSNSVGAQTEQVLGGHRTIARASITLSDGARLGDENAILSRGGEFFSIDPVASLSSELSMSDATRVRDVQIVDFMTIDSRSAWLVYPVVEVGSLPTSESLLRMSASRVVDRKWTGGWDATPWMPSDRIAGMVMTNTPAPAP